LLAHSKLINQLCEADKRLTHSELGNTLFTSVASEAQCSFEPACSNIIKVRAALFWLTCPELITYADVCGTTMPKQRNLSKSLKHSLYSSWDNYV